MTCRKCNGPIKNNCCLACLEAKAKKFIDSIARPFWMEGEKAPPDKDAHCMRCGTYFGLRQFGDGFLCVDLDECRHNAMQPKVYNKAF